MDQPTLLIDLDQAKSNLKVLLQHIPDHCQIRLASKSIRCPEILKLLIEEIGARSIGVMCFHPDEIPFLHGHGIKDVLLAYPVYTKAIAARLALHQQNIEGSAHRMNLMADLPEHLDLLEQAARSQQVTLNIIVDIDVSTHIPGLHFGVHRSSLRTNEQISNFISTIIEKDSLQFQGLMSYEAQIAGISDFEPSENKLKNFIIRILKKFAVNKIHQQRQSLKNHLTAKFDLDWNNLRLNGGGSGSVASTAKDPFINEITIGSGILCPSLFENYKGLPLRPAICFGLPVVRKPSPMVRTLFGGGYMASGALSMSKQPRVFYPKGWKLTSNEGLGEVQTPLFQTSRNSPDLKIGDSVYFVPAKSGETMERFNEIFLASFSENNTFTTSISYKTYRGLGVCYG